MNRTVVVLLLLAMMIGAGSGLRAEQTPPTATPKTVVQPQAPVNLNTATKADLEKLPGIGPSMAQRILDYRQKNGSFKKIEELMNVQGIGEKSFLKLRTLVTVAPAKTTDR